MKISRFTPQNRENRQCCFGTYNGMALTAKEKTTLHVVVTLWDRVPKLSALSVCSGSLLVRPKRDCDIILGRVEIFDRRSSGEWY